MFLCCRPGPVRFIMDNATHKRRVVRNVSTLYDGAFMWVRLGAGVRASVPDSFFRIIARPRPTQILMYASHTPKRGPARSYCQHSERKMRTARVRSKFDYMLKVSGEAGAGPSCLAFTRRRQIVVVRLQQSAIPSGYFSACLYIRSGVFYAMNA